MTTSRMYGLTFMMMRALLMSPIRRTPRKMLSALPLPPESATPPTITAASESSA